MALVHTVVLKPRLVLADAMQRFARRPLALWVVGFLTLLPDLFRSHPLPNNMEAWQQYLSNMPSMGEFQAQMTHEAVTNTLGFVAGILAWPILTMLTQGVPMAGFAQVGLARLWGAACATALAVVSLVGLTVALLLPALIAFGVTHEHGTPWLAMPGLDHMGFWLIAVGDGFAALLVVSLVGGALMVVPAEACAHPAPARTVVQRSWTMCREHLGGAAWVLGWLLMLTMGVGLFTDLAEGAGFLGRMLSIASQGALATMPALAGASLHHTLSRNQDSAAVGGDVGVGLV